MSYIGQVVNRISSFSSTVVQHYPTSLASQVFCGAVVTEMAVRTLQDGWKYLTDQTLSAKDKTNLGYDFFNDLGGAVFYGLCAVNYLPGTALLGALSFTLYSIVGDVNEKDYLLTRLLNHTYTTFCAPVVDTVCISLCTAINKISDVVTQIFSYINLPVPPIWVAVALLGTATLGVMVGYPVLRGAISRI